jgi:DNA-binding helix-hairpin-helix protein with protein kinase domain
LTATELPAERQTVAAASRCQHSRVSNGKLHARGVNGRSAPARRYRDAVAGLCSELGQELADMPESLRALVRLTASAIVQNEELQAAQARGEAVDGDLLVRVGGQLARCLDALQVAKAARLEAERQTSAEAARRRLGMPDWSRK